MQNIVSILKKFLNFTISPKFCYISGSKEDCASEDGCCCSASTSILHVLCVFKTIFQFFVTCSALIIYDRQTVFRHLTAFTICDHTNILFNEWRWLTLPEWKLPWRKRGNEPENDNTIPQLPAFFLLTLKLWKTNLMNCGPG